MVTKSKLSPARRARRALVLLFEEARRLERQRRRRYAGFLSAACVVAGAGGFFIARDGSDPLATSDSRPVTPLVSSLALPKAGDYFSLAIVDDRALVSGGPTGSLFPTGITSLSDGRAVGTCDAATVEPGTLKLGHVAHANCGDPALYGEQVLAISYPVRRLFHGHTVSGYAVRIAHADSGAPDGYTLGSVVMTYPQCSDCSAQWIYGDGSLWLYDSYDGWSFAHPDAQLLRVSTDGKVAQHWSIPQEPRELLVVDADGLWFAPSIEGGYPSHLSASQRIRYESLYRVTPGARAPTRVFEIGAGGAAWLVAAGHTVWLDTGLQDRNRHDRFVLWRLHGPKATPTLHGSYAPNTDQGDDLGEDPPTHAGNDALGIYYVADPGFGSPENARQQIIRLSPDAAKEQAVATVPSPPDIDSYADGPGGVALGRSFYFLNPPLLDHPAGDKPPIVQGQGVLYRVTPK
jgi:hypothetical protein